MIKITTYKDFGNFITEHSRYVNLAGKEEVVNEFRRLVEWHSAAFKDKMSRNIMKEIDHAVRVGAYGVRTEEGKTCITSLSTDCKFALILWYYHDKDVTILTNLDHVGGHVWEFIHKNMECSLHMIMERIEVPLELKIPLEIDGMVCENFSKILEVLFQKQDKIYEITKETELEAYNHFVKWNDKGFDRMLKEELELEQFVKSIEADYNPGDYDMDYHVVNYCGELSDFYEYETIPVWIVGKKGDSYQFFSINSVRNPDFLELLVNDIIHGFRLCKGENIYFSEEYDEFFALVLDCEERCRIREYPEQVAFGVLCKPAKKTVEIYDKRQAVHRFHERYGKTKG